MKLLTYQTQDGPRCGALIDGDQIIDVSTALGTVAVVSDVRALLELPDRPLDRLREALETTHEPVSTLENATLRAPIIQPPSVRDFAAFEEHITQQWTRDENDTIDGFGYLNMEVWRRMPIFYFSNPHRILGTGEDLVFPAGTNCLDYECELGVVIGKDGTDVLAGDAESYIAGFTIFNDWSPRDLQADEMGASLGPAKGKDTATSLGPWVVTPDEFGDRYKDGVLSLRAQVRVNGETWGDRGTWNMVHSFPDMIERASQDSRIVPGDVFGSGTVGMGTVLEGARLGRPARWLRPGDVVELEVEGIGVLANRIVEPTRETVRWPAPFTIPIPTALSPEKIASVEARVAQPID